MDLEQTIVEKLYFNDKEQNGNLFDLYYDIKPAGFNRYLLLPCLEDIKNDVLSESENIQKIFFCTKMIGRCLYVFSEHIKNDQSEYEPVWLFGPYKKILEKYQFFTKSNERKKWWTLLNILLAKQCLFDIYPKEDNSSTDLQSLLHFLDINNSLYIDSTTVNKYDNELIQELNIINPWRPVILTRESCERKIEQIKKDIEEKKDLSVWII